jgi:ParB family chromosome partitioning protein
MGRPAWNSNDVPRARANAASPPPRPEPRLEQVPVEKCRTLRRNPQFLTAAQMDSLKMSIQRDGFLVPILVRPLDGGRYEVVSGNHRLLAAREVGLKTVPALVTDLNDQEFLRLAVNLNTIHGEPQAELLAPFLAELADEMLATVHLEAGLIKEMTAFDGLLEMRLAQLQIPEPMDAPSPISPLPTGNCICPKCGHRHVAARKTSS